MKTLTKFCVVIASAFLSAGSCSRDDGWGPGGPISGDLLGTWKLEKVVTSKRTVRDEQIGYSEILKIAYEGGYHVEQTYRNDSLTTTEYWGFDPRPVAKEKDNTVLVSYRYGLKRFYKMHKIVSQPTILEATAYLPEIGGAADSVKFFYKAVW